MLNREKKVALVAVGICMYANNKILLADTGYVHLGFFLCCSNKSIYVLAVGTPEQSHCTYRLHACVLYASVDSIQYHATDKHR